MNIVACCKIAPDMQDISVEEDGDVNFDRAKWEISEFDLQAIEAGAQLAQDSGGKLSAITLGESRINTTQLRKDLLSRGPEDLLVICDDELSDADSFTTGQLLAAGIRRMNADVVLCGDGSADLYSQQTALQIGLALEWNTVTDVCSLEDADGKLVVERELEDCVQKLEIDLPTVLSVTSGINTPPRPTMKMLLSAGKKPVEELPVADLGSIEPEGLRVDSTKAVEEPDRKKLVISADTLEASVSELVGYLKSEKVL